MNGVLNLPNFPMMFGPNMMGMNPMGAAPNWTGPPVGDERAGGPIRRGGGAAGGGGRYQNRSGPYDRRPNPRFDSPMGGAPGGRGRPTMGNRWGDGAAGGAAMGPREAVQGRTLKKYDDLDEVAGGGGGGELNY